MRPRFDRVLSAGRVLLMDGAMGTELQRSGGFSTARSVHRSYIAAGAEVLLTDTFQSNPLTVGDAFEAAAMAAVEMAREEAGHSRFVLFDAGPLVGKNRLEFDDAAAWQRVVDVVHRCREHLDGLLIETCSTEAALNAAREAFRTGLPVLLSLWFKRDDEGRYFSHDGHTPEWFAHRAGGLAALGVNCGSEMGMSNCANVIGRYREATSLPLFARPNAGTPIRTGNEFLYPWSPDSMAAELPVLLDAGIAMVGGCCGTTPAHTAAFRRVLNSRFIQ